MAKGKVAISKTVPTARGRYKKNGENGHFWLLFKFRFGQNFQKLKKKTFLIDLEWSILAKGKVAISKTVPTARGRYIHIYQPNIGIATEL